MNFKERLKRFFGIRTFEEIEKHQKKTPQQKVKEFVQSLFFAGIAALLIITFIVQNTRIPTGSMENTILVGDFVIVNKFIFGASSPRYVPFTEIALPYFTLPSFREPQRKDIVVFEFPGHRDQLMPTELNVNYVKRCIGLPGDTIQIIDRVVFVNGEEFWIPSYINYLKPFSQPEGMREPRIFPPGKEWNEDNYGPFEIPKKGDIVKLTLENIEQWRTLIDREFGKRIVGINNGKVTIEGKEVYSYVIKKDYYFMMGDNRDNSLDSRYWGFVSRDRIIGEAFLVLFSWDRNIPFTRLFDLIASIRPERILNLID